MAEINIILDSYESLVVDKIDGNLVPGLMKTIYLGDNDTPSSEKTVTLEELLNEFIDSNSIPTNPPSLKPEYFQLISEGLEAIAQVVEKAKSRIQSMPYWEEKDV